MLAPNVFVVIQQPSATIAPVNQSVSLLVACFPLRLVLHKHDGTESFLTKDECKKETLQVQGKVHPHAITLSLLYLPDRVSRVAGTMWSVRDE